MCDFWISYSSGTNETVDCTIPPTRPDNSGQVSRSFIPYTSSVFSELIPGLFSASKDGKSLTHPDTSGRLLTLSARRREREGLGSPTKIRKPDSWRGCKPLPARAFGIIPHAPNRLDTFTKFTSSQTRHNFYRIIICDPFFQKR